jgi:hypothetical protein
MKKILITMLILVALIPMAAAVTPGGPDAECDAAGCVGYSYKIDDWGNLSVWASGMDGTYDDGSINISDSNNYTFNWTSETPICAVIVKGGSESNVYPGGTSGTGLVAPVNPSGGTAEISHVTFCYGSNGGGQEQEIPEFPTIALPIAAILGLAFFFQRRKD